MEPPRRESPPQRSDPPSPLRCISGFVPLNDGLPTQPQDIYHVHQGSLELTVRAFSSAMRSRPPVPPTPQCFLVSSPQAPSSLRPPPTQHPTPRTLLGAQAHPQPQASGQFLLTFFSSLLLFIYYRACEWVSVVVRGQHSGIGFAFHSGLSELIKPGAWHSDFGPCFCLLSQLAGPLRLMLLLLLWLLLVVLLLLLVVVLLA